VNQRNSDVERAVESLDGHDFPYQSFGPLVMRPRNAGELRVFTYNEFGEPEYVPELARPAAPAAAFQTQHAPAAPPSMSAAALHDPVVDPLYDRLPVMQPPAMRSMPQSPLNPPPPRPAMRPIPPAVTPPPAMTPQMMPAHMMAPPVTAQPVMPPPSPPSVEAAPSPPAPPPFFPLLAAALPNATEPSYTPSYTIAPMQAAMGTAAPGGRVGAQPGAAAENSADRRSLADMFSLLGARAPLPAGAFPSAEPLPASAPPEAQALFRRI
jgi:hypothetical protein